MNGFSDLVTAANFSTLNFSQISLMEALTKPSDPGRGELELKWGYGCSIGPSLGPVFQEPF